MTEYVNKVILKIDDMKLSGMFLLRYYHMLASATDNNGVVSQMILNSKEAMEILKPGPDFNRHNIDFMIISLGNKFFTENVIHLITAEDAVEFLQPVEIDDIPQVLKVFWKYIVRRRVFRNCSCGKHTFSYRVENCDNEVIFERFDSRTHECGGKPIRIEKIVRHHYRVHLEFSKPPPAFVDYLSDININYE